MYTTIRNNRLLNNINTLVKSQQTLIIDRCDRTSCVTSDVFSSFYITFFQSSFDSSQELLCVNFSQAQINDTFDAECKTDNQCNSNETHEECRTFDEFCFQFLVDTTFSSFYSCRSSGFSGSCFNSRSSLFGLFSCRSILSLSN